MTLSFFIYTKNQLNISKKYIRDALLKTKKYFNKFKYMTL